MSSKYNFKPVIEVYSIEDFRKFFDANIYDKEVPEFSSKDPWVYHLIRVLTEPMIQYKKAEQMGIHSRNLPDVEYAIGCNDDPNSIKLLLTGDINADNFISSKMIDGLELIAHNPDMIGNILPGYWDDRYSFDVQNLKDPHWTYMFAFLKSCVKTAQEMCEDSDLKSVKFSLLESQYDCGISMTKFADGYICKITMPMHYVATTPQFFGSVMRKRAINNILEDEDE
jgi:hypothetical protein